MKFSWDLIRTFDAVAHTGSLLAAAGALGVSQPTVGRHIDLLEEALSVSLFTRSRDGMTLTEAGANLVSTSKEMVSTAEAFQRRAAGLDTQASGVVRISANDIFGVHILPPLLRDFMDIYPEVEIELDITNAAANLSRRDADLALRMFRPTQSDLVARKVAELRLGFYAHRRYLKRYGVPARFSDLKTHRFIGFDREMFHIQAAKGLGETVVASDFRFRCDNLLAHIEGVKNGLGVGILHRGLAAGLDDVVSILGDIPLPSLELWLACHSEVRYNKRVRLLVDFLADRLRTPYPSAGASGRPQRRPQHHGRTRKR